MKRKDAEATEVAFIAQEMWSEFAVPSMANSSKDSLLKVLQVLLQQSPYRESPVDSLLQPDGEFRFRPLERFER
jgi:hypothetical protein